MMASIVSGPIVIDDILKKLNPGNTGAIVTFIGTVREKSGDITVTALEYEAYIEMAESMMQNILAGSIKKFALIDAVAVHRIGRLGIGEASIAIAVSAQHRKEGFDGCSEILNRIKAEAPIWKKDIIDEKITRWHD
ncbi:MAG: molybdenum cofactor biosynthesis protein MoaE [Thermoplasmataceae archaeon]|jgi:molybdopterin synthase catalytic subunit